jgi:hypothetical protein
MVSKRSSVAGLAVIVLLGGCGQAQTTQRTQVAAYLKQVNALETQLNGPLGDVTRVAARFASQRLGGARSPAGGVAPVNVAPLRADLTHIRALAARLAGIRTPAAATHLRRLLLAVADRQASLTRQTAELDAYLPAYDRALGPIVPATRQLERVLAIKQAYGAAAVQAVYAQKAAALRAFKARLDGVLRRLRRLRPPPVSDPSYRAQVTALSGMSTNAGKLAVALQSGNSAQIAPLLAAFDQAAVAPKAIGAQRAQIAAAKAYDRQTAALRQLAAQAESERLRLADTLR